MKKDMSFYKGYDYLASNKKDRLRNEYFNPYGYNLYSSSRNIIDTDYNNTHTNQDGKIK